jgi:hypothetical protein
MPLGISEGFSLGLPFGILEGFSLGLPLGFWEGFALGFLLGISVSPPKHLPPFLTREQHCKAYLVTVPAERQHRDLPNGNLVHLPLQQ